MDTDDLSREAYNGILMQAEELTHDLTLHYGLLSYDCEKETEYIENAKLLTKEILNANDCELDDLFFGEPPNNKKLNNTLKKILINIEEIEKKTIEERHYDF